MHCALNRPVFGRCAGATRKASQPEKALNKRKGGSGLPQYLMMELRQSLDPNRPSCPSWRRLSTSRRARRLAGRSVLRRPGCALSLDEQQMRSLPLGIQGGFPLAQRWRQCYPFEDKRKSGAGRKKPESIMKKSIFLKP
jgi:hypothetical protein